MYVYRADSLVCISALCDEVMKGEDRWTSSRTMQNIFCAEQVSHKGKNTGNSFTLLSNITNKLFIVFACSSCSCHEYIGLFHQRWCFCRLHGTIDTRDIQIFTIIRLLHWYVFCFYILYDTIFNFTVYVFPTSTGGWCRFIQEKVFGLFGENMALATWRTTIGCWYCSVHAGSNLIAIWLGIITRYCCLQHSFLTVICSFVYTHYAMKGAGTDRSVLVWTKWTRR